MEAQKMVEPRVSEEGVDLTLVRWMLSMAPAERVRTIEEMARELEELRDLNRER